MNSYLTILIGSILVNNYVMNKFMGICPFLGVSKKVDTALGMGMAVTFVMTLASFMTWLVEHYLLVPLDLMYMRTIAFILVIAVVCLVGVYLLMYKTRQGRNIRAVMQNRDMAASLGVNTRRIDSMTFAIGSGLAGLAGCALTWIGAIGPTLGTNYIVDTFMTVVVGGAGSIVGSVFGAGFIGVGGTAFEFLTNASIGKVLIFLCVIILLQFRPKGIFAVSSRALEE